MLPYRHPPATKQDSHTLSFKSHEPVWAYACSCCPGPSLSGVPAVTGAPHGSPTDSSGRHLQRSLAHRLDCRPTLRADISSIVDSLKPSWHCLPDEVGGQSPCSPPECARLGHRNPSGLRRSQAAAHAAGGTTHAACHRCESHTRQRAARSAIPGKSKTVVVCEAIGCLSRRWRSLAHRLGPRPSLLGPDRPCQGPTDRGVRVTHPYSEARQGAARGASP